MNAPKTPPKEEALLEEIEKAIRKLLKQTMADQTATLTDKTKVMDRALKLAAIKAKMEDEEWGQGFQDAPDA